MIEITPEFLARLEKSCGGDLEHYSDPGTDEVILALIDKIKELTPKPLGGPVFKTINPDCELKPLNMMDEMLQKMVRNRAEEQETLVAKFFVKYPDADPKDVSITTYISEDFKYITQIGYSQK